MELTIRLFTVYASLRKNVLKLTRAKIGGIFVIVLTDRILKGVNYSSCNSGFRGQNMLRDCAEKALPIFL
jgi:hypothetical protein